MRRTFVLTSTPPLSVARSFSQVAFYPPQQHVPEVSLYDRSVTMARRPELDLNGDLNTTMRPSGIPFVQEIDSEEEIAEGNIEPQSFLYFCHYHLELIQNVPACEDPQKK